MFHVFNILHRMLVETECIPGLVHQLFALLARSYIVLTCVSAVVSKFGPHPKVYVR